MSALSLSLRDVCNVSSILFTKGQKYKPSMVYKLYMYVSSEDVCVYLFSHFLSLAVVHVINKFIPQMAR